MIFVTSDLHLGHNKPFLYEPRGFTNIYDHDAALVKNWNSVITDDDEVYILGDLMLMDNNYGQQIFNQLRGQKHIILGNHDSDVRIELYKTLNGVVDIKYADVLKWNKYQFFLSHYPTLTTNLDVEKLLKHRVICLCGHTHTANKYLDMDKGLIYHCELDAHAMYPVRIDMIVDDINDYFEG